MCHATLSMPATRGTRPPSGWMWLVHPVALPAELRQQGLTTVCRPCHTKIITPAQEALLLRVPRLWR